ncbi:PAAR-like domain-containing protein [Salmonella bongori]|uniref:PAAR-like domain-containing protein n=1 Tax=Salmonella bongori TaxID=54736 RepID=UPI00155951B3|nr:PAAR-like domain-containing protein [Salmonella bongori]
MITININGLTLCHKGSGGISHNTLPDVCKTPPFGVPVPYENEAYSADLIKGTTSVLTDKLFMNHGNTVNMAGELQAALDDSIQAFKNKICEWAKECYIKYCGGGLGPKSSGADYAHYQDCLNKKIKDDAYEYDDIRKKYYPSGDTARELSFKPVDGKSAPIFPRGSKLGKWSEWGVETIERSDLTASDLGTSSGRRRIDLVVKVLGKIKYLFDVKFPEDGFTEEQEKAYHRIAEDIGADFEPFYLEDECTDWPECPNEEEKKLSQEEIQEAIRADIQRQMHPDETDWTLIGLVLLASAATLCPFDGPAGDLAAWSAVAARWGTKSAPAL